MARNAVKKASPVPTTPAAEITEAPAMRGGALGSPATLTRVGSLPSRMIGSRRVSEAPTGRQFEVVRSPGMVGYPGQGKVRLPVGKVVSDASCDLDHLRRQGVVLKEITPEPPPAPEPEEELIPVDAGADEETAPEGAAE